ncbi:MAG: septal ring lytic transglycosylase RlpA family protein [Desulfobulbaceae bacterium]|nr:septal ring lytic transglycosylase RlpA family protein [Desulfobulbaceae bacterium]
MNRFISAGMPLFAIALLAAGCAPKIIPPVSPPVERVEQTPATVKRVPPASRVPATQRPYRIDDKTYYPLPSAEGFEQRGIASWYGNPFHGRKTSNGETYNMHEMTAAHKTLPMNTRLLVKNLENGKEAVVRVNDRGPFVRGRIIDLSHEAANRLDVVGKGTAPVQIIALGEAATFAQGQGTVERFLPHQDFRHGEFYVQIGSFTNKENANRLKEKMIAEGRKTVIQTWEGPDQIFYRVQVRAGTELEHADRAERALNEAGYPGAFVVAR